MKGGWVFILLYTKFIKCIREKIWERQLNVIMFKKAEKYILRIICVGFEPSYVKYNIKAQ